jgi:GPH family glycoside/pentoside/hexuronide:cation symporter
MQTVAIWFGVIVIVVTAFPTIFIKEPRNAEIKKQPKVKILLSLKETLQVKEFRLLIAALLAICLGLFMVGPLGTYVTIYHVYGGDQKSASALCGASGMLYGLSTLLASPFVSLLSSRFGKKRTLLGGLSLGLIGVISKYFTYNPAWPYLQLISVLMMAPGLSCLWVLSPSMTADICDLDELRTFTRREGMFSAMYGYMMKVGVSLGVLLTGFLLSTSGFNAALGADQPESAILILRICFSVIPAIGIITGIILLSRYHLSAERVQGIQRQIKERRNTEEK